MPAGRSPVAVDPTAASPMGSDAHDMESAALAERVGAGPRRSAKVDVVGADPDVLRRRFGRAGSAYRTVLCGGDEWARHANCGLGPRYLTLLGPVASDHAFTGPEPADPRPVPGQGGGSEPVGFDHDRIDLEEPLGARADCAVHAFTWFSMAASDCARDGAGADDLAVWTDGLPVCEHAGRRLHRLGPGRCGPVDDPWSAGHTDPGLRSGPDRWRPDAF